MISIESIYNKVCQKILSEDKKESATERELTIANSINNYFISLNNLNKDFTLRASRPSLKNVNVKANRYSDIKIYNSTINDDNIENNAANSYCWIEVKKDHGSLVYNGRAAYKGNNWTGENYSSKTRFSYSAYNKESNEDKGTWHILAGDEKRNSTLNKDIESYINKYTKNDSQGKSPTRYIERIVEFLNEIKDFEKYPTLFNKYIYKNKYRDKYLNFYIPFYQGADTEEIALESLNKITDEDKLKVWLYDVKQLNSGDILFLGGTQEGYGRISPYIFDDFLSWLKPGNISDNIKNTWPKAFRRSEPVSKLVDLSVNDIFPNEGMKHILIDHYTVDKNLPASYIQMGNDFYGIKKGVDPLCFSDDLPYISDVFKDGMPGTMYLDACWKHSENENRTHDKKVSLGYDIRIRAMDPNAKEWKKYESPYSFLPEEQLNANELKKPFPPIPNMLECINIINNTLTEHIKNKHTNTKLMIEAEEDPSKKTIALVGGSFKPPHTGHFDMVEQYAKAADKVIVVISDPKKSVRTTKTGTIITPQMAKDIWDIYIDRYNLNNKVEVKISSQASPIAAIYDYIGNTLKDCNIILGASKKGDDYKRFSKAEAYFIKNGRYDINILDPEETAVEPFANHGKPISASDIHDNIDDPEIIKTMLPAKLNDEDIEGIINILSN